MMQEAEQSQSRRRTGEPVDEEERRDGDGDGDVYEESSWEVFGTTVGTATVDDHLLTNLSSCLSVESRSSWNEAHASNVQDRREIVDEGVGKMEVEHGTVVAMDIEDDINYVVHGIDWRDDNVAVDSNDENQHQHNAHRNDPTQRHHHHLRNSRHYTHHQLRAHQQLYSQQDVEGVIGGLLMGMGMRRGMGLGGVGYDDDYNDEGTSISSISYNTSATDAFLLSEGNTAGVLALRGPTHDDSADDRLQHNIRQNRISNNSRQHTHRQHQHLNQNPPHPTAGQPIHHQLPAASGNTSDQPNQQDQIPASTRITCNNDPAANGLSSSSARQNHRETASHIHHHPRSGLPPRLIRTTAASVTVTNPAAATAASTREVAVVADGVGGSGFGNAAMNFLGWMRAHPVSRGSSLRSISTSDHSRGGGSTATGRRRRWRHHYSSYPRRDPHHSFASNGSNSSNDNKTDGSLMTWGGDKTDGSLVTCSASMNTHTLMQHKPNSESPMHDDVQPPDLSRRRTIMSSSSTTTTSVEASAFDADSIRQQQQTRQTLNSTTSLPATPTKGETCPGEQPKSPRQPLQDENTAKKEGIAWEKQEKNEDWVTIALHSPTSTTTTIAVEGGRGSEAHDSIPGPFPSTRAVITASSVLALMRNNIRASSRDTTVSNVPHAATTRNKRFVVLAVTIMLVAAVIPFAIFVAQRSPMREDNPTSSSSASEQQQQQTGIGQNNSGGSGNDQSQHVGLPPFGGVGSGNDGNDTDSDDDNSGPSFESDDESSSLNTPWPSTQPGDINNINNSPPTKFTVDGGDAATVTTNSTTSTTPTQPTPTPMTALTWSTLAPTIFTQPLGTITPTQLESRIWDIITTASPPTVPKLADYASPQYQAYKWLLNNTIIDDVVGVGYNLGDVDVDAARSKQKILQRFSIVTFYYSTGGDNWVERVNWLDPTVDECEWFNRYETHNNGIVESPRTSPACNDDGLLVILALWDNNLRGSIPVEIALLGETIRVIDISYNRITGPALPIGSIENLRLLETLNLSHNELSGPLTDDLGIHLVNLRMFDVSYNAELSGEIPPSMADIMALDRIYLGFTALTGDAGMFCIDEDEEDEDMGDVARHSGYSSDHDNNSNIDVAEDSGPAINSGGEDGVTLQVEEIETNSNNSNSSPSNSRRPTELWVNCDSIACNGCCTRCCFRAFAVGNPVCADT